MENELRPSDEDRHGHLLPTTKLGRLSVRLLAVCLGVFIIAIAISLTLEGGDSEEPADFVRAIIGSSFLITGLGALVSAAIAMVRDHERSVLVWLALLLGLLATAFALGDVIFPE